MFKTQSFLILPCDAMWWMVRNSNPPAPPKGLRHLAYGNGCRVTCFVDEGDGQHLLAQKHQARMGGGGVDSWVRAFCAF